MLRNDSDHVVSEKLHKLLTTESVRKKDRMAVEPLLELTNQELLDFLKSKGTIFLTMNILPDRYRINDSNKRGLYNHPFAISTAGTGSLVFLNWDAKSSRSDLVRLRLHSPAKTVVLERGIQTSSISLCYMNGIGRHGGLMVSALDSRFEPWLETLCCVLGQDTLLSRCLSSPRCINGYR